MSGVKGIFDVYSVRNHSNVIAIGDLRASAKQRLHAANLRTDKAPQTSSGSSLLGSMFLNMLGLSAIGSALHHTPLGDLVPDCVSHIPDGFLSGVFEGACMVRDEKAEGYRRRKLNDYPEGRRADPMAQKSINKKFNMAAGNDNDALSVVAAMAEMIDMLDVLEKQGVTALNLDEKTPVYDTLKVMTRRHSRKDVFSPMTVPHRKAL